MGKQLFPAMYLWSTIPHVLKRHKDLTTISESQKTLLS